MADLVVLRGGEPPKGPDASESLRVGVAEALEGGPVLAWALVVVRPDRSLSIQLQESSDVDAGPYLVTGGMAVVNTILNGG